MEEREYEEKLRKLYDNYNWLKITLDREFGLSHSKYKIGDIVKESNIGFVILIDKISTYKSFGLPEPVYHGVELTKDFKPKKNGNKRSIYGNTSSELIKST